MDKKILRNFATSARQIMENDTRAMLGQFGITIDSITDPTPTANGTMLLFNIGKSEPNIVVGKKLNQYNKLISEINKSKEKNLTDVINNLIEEVAYTWFNRIIAIRFMEINGYLPDNIRILSSIKEGIIQPDIINNFEYANLGISEDEKIELIKKRNGDAKDLEELFQVLFIKTCNKLNESLPDLFEKTDDYAELLLNISYSDPNGVIRKLLDEVPEEYFDVDNDGALELFGWIYQFYNDESKSRIKSKPKTHKITSEELPIITQLYTPDWIVKYMVQNSLGRIWANKMADTNNLDEESFIEGFNWNYYITGNEIIKNDLSLEDIKMIDPAMGSGHILLYSFDLLMQIYLTQGYTKADAAKSIIEKNLYGLDIDMRAYQISYFTLMMKGRLNDRNFLKKHIKPNLNYFIKSNEIEPEQLEYFGHNLDEKNRTIARRQILEIINIFENADDLGSIIKLDSNYDIDLLTQFLNDLFYDQLSITSLNINEIQEKLFKLVNLVSLLTNKYEATITNPPYLSASNFNPILKNYSSKNYQDSKGDLYSIFIEVCLNLTKENFYIGLITMHGWMFLTTYERLRDKILSYRIENLVHLGTNAFEEIGGEVVQTSAYIINKSPACDREGIYVRLVDVEETEDKEKTFLDFKKSKNHYYFNQKNFYRIPGCTFGYWLTDEEIATFNNNLIGNEFPVKKGMDTGDNNKFLRLWFEVDFRYVGLFLGSGTDTIALRKKWVPYDKGGYYKKWYGNNEYIIFWEQNGLEISNSKANLRSKHLYFKNHITWNALASDFTCARLSDYGAIFDSAGSSMFPSDIYLYLGFINSNLLTNLFKAINPTLNYTAGSMSLMPSIPLINKELIEEIREITIENIDITKNDLKFTETNWSFIINELIHIRKMESVNSINEIYKKYRCGKNNNFKRIQNNEICINKYLNNLFGLENIVNSHVEDSRVTITNIVSSNKEKINMYSKTKKEVIKDFISYAVGCMFGRYSLDKEGLVWAGGEIDYSNYKTYLPDKDNIIIICEDHVEDDIVAKFQEFVREAFGDEYWEDNIAFIADTLGGKGTYLDKIRNYFVKDFFKDHAKNYSVSGSGKRPIYWLYDSGKQNAFKALIYMHRYDKDTTGRVRVDYLHRVQRMYEDRLSQNNNMIDILDNARDKSRLEKENEVYRKKLEEIRVYDKRIAVLADMRIDIDLDDGVKVNHEKIQIGKDGNNLKILEKI